MADLNKKKKRGKPKTHIISPSGLVLMTFSPNSSHHGSYLKNISTYFEYSIMCVVLLLLHEHPGTRLIILPNEKVKMPLRILRNRCKNLDNHRS